MKALLLALLSLSLLATPASAKNLRYLNGLWTGLYVGPNGSYSIDNIRFVVKKNGRISGGTATYLVTNIDRSPGVISGRVFAEKPYKDINGVSGYVGAKIILNIRSASGIRTTVKGVIYVNPRTLSYNSRVKTNGRLVSLYH